MPTSKRGYEIDLSHEGAYTTGDKTLYDGADHTAEVDMIIGVLDEQRRQNADNQVLDPILGKAPEMKGRYNGFAASANPLEAERITEMDEMGALTNGIVKGLLRNPDGMSIEDLDYFTKIQKANAQYNKEDMAMDEMEQNIQNQINAQGYDTMEGYMEASIMADLGKVESRIRDAEDPNAAIVESDVEEVKEDESEVFPAEAVNTEATEYTPEVDTVESLGEAVQVNNDMEPVKSFGDTMKEAERNGMTQRAFKEKIAEDMGILPIKEIDTTPTITDEDLEDVPVSTLEVTDDQVLTNMHNIIGEGISDNDAMALIDIMRRYKAGEKFSVFNALPEAIKIQIRKSASETGEAPRHAILEFFAKNLINDIISDAFMSTEINNFQEELNTYAKAAGNVTGVIVDSYTDEVKEKFETGLLETADKIQESNPEKAEELREIAKYFCYTHTLELIKKHIENGGDTYLNRCYKKSRKIKQYTASFNAYYEGTVPKIRDIKSLAIPFRQLMVDEEVADTLVVMLGDSCYEQPKGSLVGNIYAFYLLTGVMNIAMSADTSDTIREIRNNIAILVSEVSQFLHRRMKDSKYGGKKKKGKKGKR